MQIQKEKKGSITPTPLLLPEYNAGQRCALATFVALPVEAGGEANTAQKKNLALSLAVPLWTGFNIRTKMGNSTSRETISYLPTINTPATQLSTVHAVLSHALKIKDALNLQEIVCVFDQAVYAKAAEIVWKHQDRFHTIILRMGAFHKTCMLLSIIGKWFRDAGLRDLAVESGVIAEGSIDKVLESCQYNRGVRLHKLVYEAILRLAWKGFYSWLEEHQPGDMILLSVVNKTLKKFQENIWNVNLDEFLNNHPCSKILERVTKYMEVLRVGSGDLAAFWMSYVDLVDLLLGLIRTSREGNWLLHLHSITSLIPWCFDYDRQNYARYLPNYYAEMTRLAEVHPNTFEHFQNGCFSVQIGDCNPFGRIPVAHTNRRNRL